MSTMFETIDVRRSAREHDMGPLHYSAVSLNDRHNGSMEYVSDPSIDQVLTFLASAERRYADIDAAPIIGNFDYSRHRLILTACFDHLYEAYEAGTLDPAESQVFKYAHAAAARRFQIEGCREVDNLLPEADVFCTNIVGAATEAGVPVPDVI